MQCEVLARHIANYMRRADCGSMDDPPRGGTHDTLTRRSTPVVEAPPWCPPASARHPSGKKKAKRTDRGTEAQKALRRLGAQSGSGCSCQLLELQRQKMKKLRLPRLVGLHLPPSSIGP